MITSDSLPINIRDLTDGEAYFSDGKLRSVVLRPEHGSGLLFEARALKVGVTVVFQDFSLYPKSRRIRLLGEDPAPSIISFSSICSGVKKISYPKPRVSLGFGSSNIDIPAYMTGYYTELEMNSPVQSFTVCIDPNIITKFTDTSVEKLVEKLELLDYLANRNDLQISRMESLDYAQKMCAMQALDSLTNYPEDTLFLEAKAFELVSLQMRQLNYLLGEKSQNHIVIQGREKIIFAGEILRKEMANPPNRLELAHRIGLNPNQLFQGFKEIYGVCPFEYLRVIRLEKARELIFSRECNITEAAFHVGYSSLSHFSKAFRKKFGKNPKEFAKIN